MASNDASTRKTSFMSNLIRRVSKSSDTEAEQKNTTSHTKSKFTFRDELGMKPRSWGMLGFRGNPVVVVLSQVVIWSLIIAAIVRPDSLFVSSAQLKTDITKNFTWLYIGAQNVWVFFIAYIWLSPRYSKIKLGTEADKPEYSTVTWFMMMFMSAGAGTGLIYYGVGEPIYHLRYNRYVAKGTMSFNEISQEAMNLSYYHWGVHQWMCYTIVALCQGMVTHRMGLPLSFRSCFFPIFGTKIYHWFGDLVDTLAAVSTVLGICTSMGIGAVQINTGIHRLNNKIEKSILVQAFLIAIMTVLGGVSAHAGLKRGVRTLSVTAFLCCTLVMIMVFVVEDTAYLLNLMVQSIGHHIHYFVLLGTQTDAFEQLDSGVDDKAGPSIWMDWWTVFYWGWWVSWSPFVALFIAKISKGRSLKEVINASLSGPVLYNFIWFAVFGGSGLNAERRAIVDGCLGNCAVTKAGKPFSRKFCSPRTNLSVQGIASRQAAFLKARPGGCVSITQLSAYDLDEMWFELVTGYENIGDVIGVVSIISMVLFFITTNDSGSIVLDYLGTTGEEKANKIQKQLWSLTLGATSIALLIAGGALSLTAIQTAMVAIGLPLTVLVTVICTSLKTACDMELHPDTVQNLTVLDGRFDSLLSNDNGFEFWRVSMLGGILNSIDFVLSLGQTPFPSLDQLKQFSIAFFAPWYYTALVQEHCEGRLNGKYLNIFRGKFSLSALPEMLLVGSCGLSFYCAIIFLLLTARFANFYVIGVAFYFCFGCIIVGTRAKMRRTHHLLGDLFRDFLAVFLAYPFALIQMYNQALEEDFEMKNGRKKSASLVIPATVGNADEPKDQEPTAQKTLRDVDRDLQVENRYNSSTQPDDEYYLPAALSRTNPDQKDPFYMPASTPRQPDLFPSAAVARDHVYGGSLPLVTPSSRINSPPSSDMYSSTAFLGSPRLLNLGGEFSRTHHRRHPPTAPSHEASM